MSRSGSRVSAKPTAAFHGPTPGPDPRATDPELTVFLRFAEDRIVPVVVFTGGTLLKTSILPFLGGIFFVYQKGKPNDPLRTPRQPIVFMDLSFRNRKLEKLANSGKEQQKQLGTNAAKKFKRRLDDLRAARNLAEMALLPGRLHPLTGDRLGELSLDLEHPYRLLMVPAHDPVPIKKDGGLDWEAITAVEITEITDTHD